MAKIIKWSLGIIVTVVMGLALIGYLSGPQPKKVEVREVISKPTAREQLAAILDKKDLTLCEVYQWIEDMEQTTRRSFEAKNPTMNAVDRIQRIEQLRDTKWLEYCQQKSLPDSIRPYVNAYGFEECK